jgi:hypothetical protein
MRNLEVSFRGVEIPTATPEETVNYLGAALSPWYGAVRTDVYAKLIGSLDQLGRAPLKPQQKLILLRGYLFPGSCIHCKSRNLAKRLLPWLTWVSEPVKLWLKLPSETTDNLFYARVKDGGLGIPKLSRIVPLTVVNLGLTLLENEDPLVARFAASCGLRASLAVMARLHNLPWPVTKSHLPGLKTTLKSHESVRWETLNTQGKGVADFREDKVGNQWLFGDGVLTPTEFISALRLRTNQCSTKDVLAITRPNYPVTCRHCFMGQCWDSAPSPKHCGSIVTTRSETEWARR